MTVFLGLVFLISQVPQEPSKNHPDFKVKVVVEGVSPVKPVQGAKLWIRDERGKDIFSGETDDAGLTPTVQIAKEVRTIRIYVQHGNSEFKEFKMPIEKGVLVCPHPKRRAIEPQPVASQPQVIWVYDPCRRCCVRVIVERQCAPQQAAAIPPAAAIASGPAGGTAQPVTQKNRPLPTP